MKQPVSAKHLGPLVARIGRKSNDSRYDSRRLARYGSWRTVPEYQHRPAKQRLLDRPVALSILSTGTRLYAETPRRATPPRRRLRPTAPYTAPITAECINKYTSLSCSYTNR